MLNSMTVKFVDELRRNLWNISDRNQVAFDVSVNHIRLSEPLGQHSVHLSISRKED